MMCPLTKRPLLQHVTNTVFVFKLLGHIGLPLLLILVP